jgi:hypothetical protein
MVILFLQLFIGLSLANNYTFDDANIAIQTVSSGQVLAYSGEITPCGNLIVRSNQIYHVSSSGVYQSSLKGQLNSLTASLNLTTGSPATSFDVSP